MNNKILTNLTTGTVRTMLWNYAVGRFKWEGLPGTLTSERIERFICGQGLAIGFKNGGRNLILPGTETGEMDVMWAPTKYIAYGFNETFNLTRTNCVRFHNNSAHTGLNDVIDSTVKDIEDCLYSARVNVRQQKNPWAFAGSPQEIESLRAALAKRDENGAIMLVSKSVLQSMDGAKRFMPLDTVFKGQELMQHYRTILNNFFTILGIDNVPIEKAERLITSEANSNNSVVRYNRLDALRMRQEACAQYNRMYYTDLSVRWVGCTDCEGDFNGITVE